FRILARGRTAIIITHRLTTAMRADVIHVMAHGRIVESGCHEELLARGGRYAQSWTAQMNGEATRALDLVPRKQSGSFAPPTGIPASGCFGEGFLEPPLVSAPERSGENALH